MDKDERLKVQKEFLVKFSYWAVWAVAAFVLVKFVGPVLLPFIAAFLAAWLLQKPVDIITEKMHLKRSLVAVTVVVIFYALLGGILYIAGSRLAGLLQNVFEKLTIFYSGTVFPMLEHFFAWMEELTTGVNPAAGAVRIASVNPQGVIDKAQKVVSGVSGPVLTGVSNMAACIPGICMKVLIAMIATVFMELEFHAILKFCMDQIPDKWKKTILEGKTYMMGTLGKCILSYGLILALTFVELSAGLLLLRVEGAVLIAFLIAMLDILPVLGTGTVLIPWAVIAISAGDLTLGISLVVLYLVITVVRNIIEPKLVGKQMGLSPVVMLPCMLVGLQFFGIIGLFAVPFGVAFLKSLNDRGIIHIFQKGDDRQSEKEE